MGDTDPLPLRAPVPRSAEETAGTSNVTCRSVPTLLVCINVVLRGRVRQDAAYVVGFPPDAVALAPASELFSGSCAEAKPQYSGEVEVIVTEIQPPPPSSLDQPNAKRRCTEKSESTATTEAAKRGGGMKAAVDWRCDGWLGYFTSTLWDGLQIDSRHCQTSRNR